MSTHDEGRDDAAETPGPDEQGAPKKAKLLGFRIPPADDPRYDGHTIVLGGGVHRTPHGPPPVEARFTPESFLERLAYLVREGPCAPEPPDEDEVLGGEDEEASASPAPGPDPDAPGYRNPYEVPDDALADADWTAMMTTEGALLAEYKANLRAASAARREGHAGERPEAERDAGGSEDPGRQP